MGVLKRVSSKLKRMSNDLLFDTPLINASINRRDRNLILMYHGVDVEGKNPFNSRHTPVSYFEKQIAFLVKTYKVVPLTRFFEQRRSETGLCAITFDDGYLNNYTHAAPVLEKYNCPATFFITGLNETPVDILWADYVNIAGRLLKDVSIAGEIFTAVNGVLYSPEQKKNILEIAKHLQPEWDYKLKIYEALDKALTFKSDSKYDIYWRLMNDAQIRALSENKLFEIGSHGYYHNNLGDIKIENAREEILRSKKYLERVIQKDITTLGYPDGSWTKETLDFGVENGFIHQTCSEAYSRGVTVNEKYIIDRNGIYNSDSAANQLLTAINS
jgi:peptidoglycan/xylan/chitin deacetylase (PgdA/CDA1 family)